MSAAKINRRLRGRRIVRVLLRPFNNLQGGTATDPLIFLDDGTTISFLTQETDCGEYGVQLIVSEERAGAAGAQHNRAGLDRAMLDKAEDEKLRQRNEPGP